MPGTGAGSHAVPPIERVRVLAKHTVGMLGLLAVLAVISAGAEMWRYVLLARSRFGALSSGVVGASDAFVYTAASLALAVGCLAIALTVWWLSVSRLAATEVCGYAPARPTRSFFVGLLVPVVNLVVAGSVLAELEHMAQQGDRDARPRPSRLVRWWWAVWVANGLCMAVAVVWRFRGGVQAQADLVVLSAVTDLVGAAVAVLTVLVIRRLVRLLAPIDPSAVTLMRVVKVTDAPAPPLRATRAWGSTR